MNIHPFRWASQVRRGGLPAQQCGAAAPANSNTPFSNQNTVLHILFYAEFKYGLGFSKYIFKRSRSGILYSKILRRKKRKKTPYTFFCVGLIQFWLVNSFWFQNCPFDTLVNRKKKKLGYVLFLVRYHWICGVYEWLCISLWYELWFIVVVLLGSELGLWNSGKNVYVVLRYSWVFCMRLGFWFWKLERKRKKVFMRLANHWSVSVYSAEQLMLYLYCVKIRLNFAGVSDEVSLSLDQNTLTWIKLD